jgi:hypothetical protein
MACLHLGWIIITLSHQKDYAKQGEIIVKRLVFALSVGITLLLLQACGGGGGSGETTGSVPSYTGLTSEARVEDSNAQSLSTAAVSGAAQSVVADASAEVFAPRSMSNPEVKLVEISPRIAQWIARSMAPYAARDVSLEFCDAGGAADLIANAAETQGTITFRNCGIRIDATDVIYMTGTIDFSGTVDAYDNPLTLNMTMHLTVTYAGESTTINLTLNCVDLSGTPSCTVRSDFVGVDGRVYRVMDITVTPYGIDTYGVDATVYDPDYGRFSMTTTAPLLLDCPNGVPRTGAVEITGEGPSSGTINFFNCTDFNVTIDGVSTPYQWP